MRQLNSFLLIALTRFSHTTKSQHNNVYFLRFFLHSLFRSRFHQLQCVRTLERVVSQPQQLAKRMRAASFSSIHYSKQELSSPSHGSLFFQLWFRLCALLVHSTDRNIWLMTSKYHVTSITCVREICVTQTSQFIVIPQMFSIEMLFFLSLTWE